jgi:hypothetical protein
MRGATSAVFLVAAAWVAWKNGAEDGGVVVFPGLDALVPSLAGDLVAQGRATVGALVVAALASGGVDALAAWRERRGSDGGG